MSDVKEGSLTSISKTNSVEGIGDFWDTHSLADRWNETREVFFRVRAAQRRRVTIDPETYRHIETLARQRGISPETLVNLWAVQHVKDSLEAQ